MYFSRILSLACYVTAWGFASAAAISQDVSTNAFRATANKPVFFHYMIGEITAPHCEKDVKDAKTLGVDAFILNVDTVTATWATGTITNLFKYAKDNDFKLFFSFDMKGFDDPNKFTTYLLSYVDHPAYYHYNNKPMVTTFNGGADSFKFGKASVNEGWKVQLQEVMAAANKPIYFVPAFQDTTITADYFTSKFPTLDGAMNWDGAWPRQADGIVEVPTSTDKTLLTAAHASQKTFMMGFSPLQFKHLDASNNWYRRGEQNLEKRFGQVLSIQPDFVELITWNDAGESHYMGNSWPEPLSTSNIGNYTKDYDHTGYWQILPAFIKAYKRGDATTSGMVPTNGKSVQGTFWHHTLLAAGTCPTDSLGLPDGIKTVEDRVSGVVLVAAGQTGLSAVVTSGTKTLGTQALNTGFNSFSFLGMTAGTVSVKVTNSAGASVVSGSGKIAVTNQAQLCNFNFQVVGLV